MTILYTSKQVQDVLRELRIKPKDGMVTTKEAAQLLTWRAEHEQEIKHIYPEAAVRRHVELGNLKIAGKRNKVVNLFKVEDVLELPLSPNRGVRQQTEPRIPAVEKEKGENYVQSARANSDTL